MAVLNFFDRPTEGRTDGRTDKASYRSSLPELKKSVKLRLLAEQAGGRVNPSLNSEILKKIVKLSQYSSLGGGVRAKNIG